MMSASDDLTSLSNRSPESPRTACPSGLTWPWPAVSVAQAVVRPSVSTIATTSAVAARQRVGLATSTTLSPLRAGAGRNRHLFDTLITMGRHSAPDGVDDDAVEIDSPLAVFDVEELRGRHA